jgi:hypothetical protein
LEIYEKELQNFNAWKQERGVSGINEDVICIGIFPQPPEKMCQLVDVNEVFHVENNVEST